MLLKQFPDKDQFRQLALAHNVIPVCAEILADTETPVSLLKKFYDRQRPVFLLESVEGGERWGRYSFLGTSVRSDIRIYADEVRIEEGSKQRGHAHNGDPLHVLKELMERYQPARIPELPRFWGGMVGYLTYEMVSFFEAVPNQWPSDQPLAHFVIPEELLIFDNIRNTLMIVVTAFTEDNASSEQLYEDARSRIQTILARMDGDAAPSAAFPRPGRVELKPRMESGRYQAHVKKTKEYIKDGDIIQAVISQPFVCDAPPDLWALYRAQRYVNPSPYLFFMHLDRVTLIGSSPETMVRLENGVATLRPIAGTRRRGKTEQEDRSLADELLQDEKERAEHLMLVDLGRNDLGRVAATGTVQVTDLMFVERYSHVMHLVSNICCDLKPECDAWDLLRATFPAGTLSGAPKIRAMEIIAELEQEPRGPYGGAVGYISFHGNMDMAITIRTACVQNGHLTVRAGAGIVADSDPEKEYMETVNKAKALEKALALMQQR
jgi:anthranilate synthase component 1